MVRRSNADVDVDTTSEVEETATPASDTPAEGSAAPEPKAKKEPARGELPEGYVTPVQLAKVLTEKGLHTNREGEVVEVKPQMVYSYMRNAPETDPFPIETVQDSLGHERQALKSDDGVSWWERKNERVSARKANAQEKASKKAARDAQKEAEATDANANADTPDAPATEAE